MPTGLTKSFWTYWIPLLACESLLCALALYRAFSGGLSEPASDGRQLQKRGHWAWRGEGGAFARRLMSIFRDGQRILDVLIRDSILYFLVYVLSFHCACLWYTLLSDRSMTRRTHRMFIAYLVNAIIWRYGSQSTFENPIGFSEAMACVLSSRLLLNVRRVLKDTEADASQVHPPSTSTTSGARHNAPVHIRTDVDIVTVRDRGSDDNLDEKADQDGSALERGAGGRPCVRLQISARQSFEMRDMKTL